MMQHLPTKAAIAVLLTGIMIFIVAGFGFYATVIDSTATNYAVSDSAIAGFVNVSK